MSGIGRRRWGPREKRHLLMMVIVVVSLHLMGWGTFAFAVLPGSYQVAGSQVFGVGLALTAYSLGVRHAFDADHIAAIDNTTRKLIENGNSRPLSVGFWFALGHSSVVVAAVALLAGGLNVLAAQISDAESVLLQGAGLWGAVISGCFLLLLGSVNLVAFNGLWRSLADYRKGRFTEGQLDAQLRSRGVLNRILRPIASQINRPAKMYPVGLLFGLGFDTATTIGLFVVAGSAALALPWYVVLVLPVLFAAGMVLFDTLDGLLMQRAYEWAFERPLRRIYYNLAVTSISVFVAFFVASVALIGAVSENLQITGGPLGWVAGIDLGNFGLIVVGVFLLLWAAAFAYWKVSGPHVAEAPVKDPDC